MFGFNELQPPPPPIMQVRMRARVVVFPRPMLGVVSDFVGYPLLVPRFIRVEVNEVYY